MEYRIYSEKTLELHEETNLICNRLYDSDIGCVNGCKYVSSAYCKAACLKEKYDIVDLKTLQSPDIDHYAKRKNICVIPNEICYKYTETHCSICLLEALLKDPYVKFIKKEDNYE